MAIRQDYLLRMIEELADSYDNLFGGADTNPLERVEDRQRALFEVEGILAEVFRTRRELLFVRPEEMIEDFDPRLAAEVARFFLRYAELSQAQGAQSAADRAFGLGVMALERGLGCELSTRPDGSNGLMRELLRGEQILEVLSRDEMAEIWRRIFEIESRLQRYELAEDAIFSAVMLADEPSDHLERGQRFFQALLNLPDEVLEEADLPREEVEEALEELRDKLAAL